MFLLNNMFDYQIFHNSIFFFHNFDLMVTRLCVAIFCLHSYSCCLIFSIIQTITEQIGPNSILLQLLMNNSINIIRFQKHHHQRMAYYARVHSKNYSKLKKNIKLLIIQRRIKQHDETRNETSHTSYTSHTSHTSHITQSHTIHHHQGRI